MDAIDRVGMAVARRFPPRPPGGAPVRAVPAAAPQGPLGAPPGDALVDPFHNNIDVRAVAATLLRWTHAVFSWLRARPRLVVTGVISLTGWIATIAIGFGSVYACFWLMWLIFNNLGERKEGEMSAYSIFNAGGERITGTFTAEDIDAQYRYGAGITAARAPPSASSLSGNIITGNAGTTAATRAQQTAALAGLRLNKDGNKPCPCGSGRKLKRCCFDAAAAARADADAALVAAGRQQLGLAPSGGGRGGVRGDSEDDEDDGEEYNGD